MSANVELCQLVLSVLRIWDPENDYLRFISLPLSALLYAHNYRDDISLSLDLLFVAYPFSSLDRLILSLLRKQLLVRENGAYSLFLTCYFFQKTVVNHPSILHCFIRKFFCECTYLWRSAS